MQGSRDDPYGVLRPSRVRVHCPAIWRVWVLQDDQLVCLQSVALRSAIFSLIILSRGVGVSRGCLSALRPVTNEFLPCHVQVTVLTEVRAHRIGAP